MKGMSIMNKKCILSIILYIFGAILIIIGIWGFVEGKIAVDKATASYAAQGTAVKYTHDVVFQYFNYVVAMGFNYFFAGVVLAILGFFNCRLNGLLKCRRANDAALVIEDNNAAKDKNVAEEIIIKQNGASKDVEIIANDDANLASATANDETDRAKKDELSKEDAEFITANALYLTPSTLKKREDTGWKKINFSNLAEARSLAEENKLKIIISKKDKTLVNSLQDIKYLLIKDGK